MSHLYFPFKIGTFWHRRLLRDQIDVEMPKYLIFWDILAFLHQFGHVKVADAKMSQFKKENINGTFWHLWKCSITWPISVKAILRHSGNHGVQCSEWLRLRLEKLLFSPDIPTKLFFAKNWPCFGIFRQPWRIFSGENPGNFSHGYYCGPFLKIKL